MWRALFLVAVSGCQCLQPVDEDAGSSAPDAGVEDAGFDAGWECDRPSDCPGTPQVVSWCSTILSSGDAGFSCVDSRCVAQCGGPGSGGQTCIQERGSECLRCPPTTSCIPASCGGGFNFTFSVIELACTGPSPLSVGSRIRETTRADGGCGARFFLETDSGEVLFGHLFLQSGRGLSARIDGLGGTCLVTDVPTGAPRMLLDCPVCQVALGP